MKSLKLFSLLCLISILCTAALAESNAVRIISAKQLNTRWTKYTNQRYGFQISHPKQLPVKHSDFAKDYLIGHDSNWPEKTIISIPVLAVTVPDYCPHTTEVRINVSDDPKDLRQCYICKYGGDTSTLDINHQHFHVCTLEDGAVGYYITLVKYSILHHEKCFSITQFDTSSNCSNYDPPPNGFLQLDNSYYFLAGKIIKTFRFIY